MNEQVRIRLVAAALFVVGCGLLAVNAWDLQNSGKFSMNFAIIGGAILFTMPFIVIVGRPVDPATGKQPIWWHVTTGVLSFLGIAVTAWLSDFGLD